MALSKPTASAHRDKAGRPVIAVTGMGVVTSLGVGKTDNWAKLTAGKSGIRRISRFPLDSLRTTIAGTVDAVYKDYMPPAELSERVALLAGEEAIAEAAIGGKGHFPGPLFLALLPLEIEWPYRIQMAQQAAPDGDAGYPDLMRVARGPQFAPVYETLKYGIIGEHLADHFGTEGSPISLTTALSTQNDPPDQASKPFSKNRDGFVLAEGAAALVLEDYDHAVARGAEVLGVLEGCGEKSDSFHRTRSSPDGKPIIACMRNALADAGVGPEDVDYINAHGTSTPENDKMEHLGVSTVFGEHIRNIPISSNKSMIGHTLTAAGAVEAVFSLLTLEHQRIPPTINHQIPDPAIPLDVVPNVARDARVTRAISNSFGFGGQNVCLVMTREPA